MNVEPSIFNESKFNEDRVGKTYKSYKDCFKSIRKFKSYLVSSMSASEKYPDLFGIFMKVSKKNGQRFRILCKYALLSNFR